MGGNALKNVKTVRLEREAYLQYEQEIARLIAPLVTNFHIPRYFPEKETFGDIDIVYTTDNPQFLDIVKGLLDSKEVAKNGDVCSCEYKNFQVDFIKSHVDYFANHCCFLDFNDFGGILGQMTNRYELKYGHKGLFIKIHEDHNVKHFIGEILLTSDPVRLFDYLKLDYFQFENGFSTAEEMFDFLYCCKFCTKQSFAKESVNVKHRRRLQHRPVYQHFIERLNDLDDDLVLGNETAVSYQSDKTQFQNDMLAEFGKLEEFHSLMEAHDNANVVRTKFNGTLVNSLTGLEASALGKFICQFKGQYADFNSYILEASNEQIAEDIVVCFKNQEEGAQRAVALNNAEECA
jgi:hypothetical protein